MCATCGCSAGAEASLIPIQGRKALLLRVPHRHAVDHSTPPAEPIVPEPELESEPPSNVVALEAAILAKNAAFATHNRGFFAARRILALNLMSSPGSGKTTLLERAIRDLRPALAFSVVEGDQATERDAERIRATGCAVVQINTGPGCHLEAHMVARAIGELDPPFASVVAIENVGNLVCPALFDLGERRRIVILSVTEGDDKPLKYPHMFRACDVVLLNKIDLLPHVDFDLAECLDHIRAINPVARCFPLSATRGDGLPAFYDWLKTELAATT